MFFERDTINLLYKIKEMEEENTEIQKNTMIKIMDLEKTINKLQKSIEELKKED